MSQFEQPKPTRRSLLLGLTAVLLASRTNAEGFNKYEAALIPRRKEAAADLERSRKLIESFTTRAEALSTGSHSELVTKALGYLNPLTNAYNDTLRSLNQVTRGIERGASVQELKQLLQAFDNKLIVVQSLQREMNADPEMNVFLTLVQSTDNFTPTPKRAALKKPTKKPRRTLLSKK